MNLRFAFAVNKNDQFEKKHFGDTDKFLIYKQEDDKIVFLSEETNRFKMMDEEVEHGSKRKGNAIIEFLKERGVNVLVSRQFGKNIKLVNEHFIPVIISLESINEVIPVLLKNMKWIDEDLQRKPENYKLFDLRKGSLKIIIKKN